MNENLLNSIEMAKKSLLEADKLIKDYLPFIMSETSKLTNMSISRSDDQVSIAMLAFHEAIKSYDSKKGKFLSYASMLIRNRLIDYFRKEFKHINQASLNDESLGIQSELVDESSSLDRHEINMDLKAEIQGYSRLLQGFDLSLTDIVEYTPKQERTFAACGRVVNYIVKNENIISDLTEKKYLPITLLSNETGVSKKTLERHRRYIIAIALVYTNGFEHLRDHLSGVFEERR